MEIRINLIEVASELAHEAMVREVENILEGASTAFRKANGNYKEPYQKIFDKWYDYYFKMISNRMDTDFFPITSTCREDLQTLGFNTESVEDSTMKELASDLEDRYVENSYWIALPIVAEELGIPKK